MRRRPIFPHRTGDDRGFAIVLVLWIAGILAVMASSLSVSVRTEVRVAANLIEAAKAEALADGGAALAIRDLLVAYRLPAHVRRFPIDGRPVRCLIPGEGVLTIAVTDEAAKIDVNAAGLPLLQALLTGLGEPPDKAARLAQSIFDFRDADDDRQPQGAEAAEYRAAGLGWLPKNGRMQSLSELGQVYGMTPEHVARLRPYLGMHSGLAGIDASLASPELIGLLRAGIEGAQVVAGDSFAAFHDDIALPAMFVSASQRSVFQLRIEARTMAGAVFSREAVLSLGSGQAPHPLPLRWARGENLPYKEEKVGKNSNAASC
jgi:general secretion pathway protein K